MPAPKIKGGQAQVKQVLHVRVNPSLYEVMKRHAFERGVFMGQLVEDVLTLWVKAVTDPDDPVFSPRRMGVRMPGEVQERRPGYRETLGFVVDPLGEDNESHLSPLPAQPSDAALL